MRSTSMKSLLSATLLLNLALTPMLALAQGGGGTIQLRPFNQQDSTYTAPSSSTGLDNYGTSYYNNDNSTGSALQGRLVSIPKGTMLTVQTDHVVVASVSHVGDPITASLDSDVYVNDGIAIPAGSLVLGQVASVSAPAHFGKHGELDIRFTSVKLPSGRVVPLQAHVVTKDETGVLKGDTYKKDVAKGVGISAGGAALGTVTGTAVGGLIGSAGAGAVFGLGIGALGGIGYAVARKGKDVSVPAGARMNLVVDAPITFSN